MFKKAGIIVGIALIAVACIIYWLVGNKTKKGEGVNTPSPSSVSTPAPKVTSTSTQQTPIEPSKTPTVTPAQVAVSEIPVGSQVFQELDEVSLGLPTITSEEIMVVAKKKVILLDSNYGAKEGKQLVYSADLLGNNNNTRLSLYLNKTAYDGIAIGDRLQVKYSVFSNNVGVQFPVVISAEKKE
jgi:lipopolysaccharide export system protein LptC